MKETAKSWDMVFQNSSEIFDGENLHDGSQMIIGVKDGLIDYIGPPIQGAFAPHTVHLDCRDKIIVPGLIDCHTHLIYGGDRSSEFSLRSGGATYESLLAAGGGIHHTVRATRRSSAEMLRATGKRRLDRMLSYGVTTVEVKSGYGLDVENELKILRVINELNSHSIDCVPTCLAAHIVPKDFKGGRRSYIDYIIDNILPRVAEEKLAEFVDIFIEDGAFDVSDGRTLFKAAHRLGLDTKVHAEQLTHKGSAELAAQYCSASADHLEYISQKGIEALLNAGTTPVLLPSCNLFLKQKVRAPARRLIDAGCSIALSTDCNPGSSMVENLLLCMSLGMTELGMTGSEVWRAVTKNAAHAIRRSDRGRLEPGLRADLALFDCQHILEVPYRMGSMNAHSVYKDGVCVYRQQSGIIDATPPRH